MTVWFDVEDLVAHYQDALRPTGIQRVSFETYRAISHLAGVSGKIRFCRRNAARTGFRSIYFPALEAGILASTTSVREISSAPPKPAPPSAIGQAARKMPLKYRLPIGVMARAVRSGLGGAKELAAALLEPVWPRKPAPRAVGGHQFDLDGPEIAFAPGDWFVNMGAPWTCAYSPEFLSALRAQGCRVAMLAHDLIPDRFPEWFLPLTTGQFTLWLHNVVPQADLMFTVSRNTASDLARALAETSKPVPPTHVIPVGSQAPARQPEPRIIEERYILMVGTIEARKNHAAMMRVWRRLLETMPDAEVPSLVFASRIGWLTTDLMQQLENTNWFSGKIRFIDSPSDAKLASLYQHCMFTVFPSLYEGWGLPVTESLCHGKTVAASNRAAIPEAGGAFCAYFDPDNIPEATATLRGLIQNPDRVEALEARIRAEFTCPGWDDTARAVLSHLGLLEHLKDFQKEEVLF